MANGGYGGAWPFVLLCCCGYSNEFKSYGGLNLAVVQIVGGPSRADVIPQPPGRQIVGSRTSVSGGSPLVQGALHANIMDLSTRATYYTQASHAATIKKGRSTQRSAPLDTLSARRALYFCISLQRKHWVLCLAEQQRRSSVAAASWCGDSPHLPDGVGQPRQQQEHATERNLNYIAISWATAT